MKFPAYWAKATAEETMPDGRTYAVKRWRWSDASPQQAHESALAAAKEDLRKLLSADEPLDDYGRYERGPVREEVKQRFAGPDGEPIAVVTQNRYGTLVLNTARVMFVDVDFPAVGAGEHLRYFFRKWFDKRALDPRVRHEQATHAKVAAFLGERPAWSARLYRTAAGLRLLVTHDLFDPVAESTREIFAQLGSDRLYVRLCRQQSCFRARLTPKPWRCGHTPNRIDWPRETDEAQRAFDAWHAGYLSKQAQYATCRYATTFGDGRVHPEAQTVIDIHDRVTRAGEELALA